MPLPAEDDRDLAAGARAAAETTGRSVLAGGVWNALAMLLPQLMLLLVSAVAARFLGPDLLGRQSFIAFVELTAISLAVAGVPVALMRTVAAAVGSGRAAQTRGLLVWAWQTMGVAALLGGLLVSSGALLSDGDEWSWVLAGVAAFTGILTAVPGAVLVGLQRWREATVAGLSTGVVETVLVIVLLSRGGGIVDIFAVQAGVGAVNLVWTGLLARRALHAVAPEAGPSGSLRSDTIRFARPVAVLAVLDAIVWKRSEVVFLVRYSPDSEIAQYSIAYAAVNALAQVPAAMTSLAGSFATLHAAGEYERVRGGFARGCRLLLTLMLPLIAGMASMGPALVELVYGSEYARAGTVLVVLLLALPLLPLAALSEALLVGQGTVTWPVRALALAVPVNLGMAALLVPDHGAVGAAVGSSTSQVVAGLPVVVVVFRRLGVRWRDLEPVMLLRSAAVAASAGVLARTVDVEVGGWAGLVLGALCFAATWLLLAITCRVLGGSDGWWLGDAVESRLGAPARRAVTVLTARRLDAETQR